MRDQKSSTPLNYISKWEITYQISSYHHEGLKSATPLNIIELYIGMGNNMSDVFISSWRMKICHPLELYIEMDDKMSDFFKSSWRIKICHPLELYREMCKNMSDIFISSLRWRLETTVQNRHWDTSKIACAGWAPSAVATSRSQAWRRCRLWVRRLFCHKQDPPKS